MALLISPKVDGSFFSSVPIGFDFLRDDPVFENRPTQRMTEKLLGRRNPEEVAKQPCVVEIGFGRLRNPFVEVCLLRCASRAKWQEAAGSRRWIDLGQFSYFKRSARAGAVLVTDLNY